MSWGKVMALDHYGEGGRTTTLGFDRIFDFLGLIAVVYVSLYLLDLHDGLCR